MERRHPLTTDNAQIEHLESRTQRALAEAMHVTLAEACGRYTVHSSSGRYYRVDVVEETCTCPDFQHEPPAGGCKHLRRVDMEIRAGKVPTPDGRLPARTASDGGATAEYGADEPVETDRIDGPIPEFDRHGNATGATYYRCTSCGSEAMRAGDLEACCSRAGDR